MKNVGFCHLLALMKKIYAPELSLRFSLKNVEKNDDLLNLPLYLLDFAERFIPLSRRFCECAGCSC